ncbi:LacI family DNA-binding transcriptional regulator [Proteiniphilum sp.]|uniref:LacI family DNA-binding transcriptional regulator n=1 Tax=Proteiniphilum sp. TaxID=1926877 RepID=UPI00332AD722
MATTIKDIAQYTGLSISTVSVALSGKANKSRITQETINRVKEAQIALNYKPNMLASGLRKGYTNTIGFVLSDVANPFFVKLASVVEMEAAKHGYRVFFAGSEEDDLKCKQAIETFVNYQVDGLIIAPTSGVKETIQQLSRRKIPFVLVDRYFKRMNVNYVVMDNYGSAYRATKYLLSKGRKRIATFSYNTDLLHMLDRFEGYRAALKEHQIRFDKRLAPVIPFMKDESLMIKEYVKDLMENQKADAFFFQTNQTALPALEFLLLNGYKIPEDVSVIVFHDNDFYKLISPGITALRQPMENLGLESVDTLIKWIEGATNVEKKTLPMLGIEERRSV